MKQLAIFITKSNRHLPDFPGNSPTRLSQPSTLFALVRPCFHYTLLLLYFLVFATILGRYQEQLLSSRSGKEKRAFDSRVIVESKHFLSTPVVGSALSEPRLRPLIMAKKPAKSAKRAGNEKIATMADDTADWISVMAKRVTMEEPVLLSKSERIERRNAKKRRRQERNPLPMSAKVDRIHEEIARDQKKVNRMSEVGIKSLARTVQNCTTALEVHSAYSRLYQAPDVFKTGKATTGNQLNEDLIQPRRRDYGGLGLARPSLYIELRDPSFVPKLEEEFAEHVPGFFGKQRTKAMKRQLDRNMLWRQLAEKRADDRKLDGKKLSDMNPDERVEAMIKARMI